MQERFVRCTIRAFSRTLQSYVKFFIIFPHCLDCVYVISCSTLVGAEESFPDVIIVKKAYSVTNGLAVSGNGTLLGARAL